mmetsp:Transcript_10847/g.25148  ORF Transcript_10847/g.25148 Transcript_10847/m.25148 type:complete len:197 (+) Transcript_10847:2-592(+)
MALGDALTKNRFLKDLNVSGNEIEDEGALAIANGLQQNKSLAHLDLGVNIIGDNGAVGLAGMLRSNSAMRELSLQDNENMTEKGREFLGCAMRHNRTLESLELPSANLCCPWYECVGFFTGCNRVRLWSLIQNENAVIPWHRAFHVLLNGRSGVFSLEYSSFHRLSALFVLLRSRPDIVTGARGRQSVWLSEAVKS